MNCVGQFSFQQCLESHLWYSGQSQLSSRDWLHTVIQASTLVHGPLHLLYRGVPVCQRAFKLLHGLSNNKFAQARKDAALPYTILTHGNLCNTNAEKPALHSQMHCWIEEYITANGDIDPVTSHVHIPAYVTHTSLYELFIADIVGAGVAPDHVASVSTFGTYMKSHFSHVHFLKHTRLGRCRFCMEYQERCHKLRTPQEIADLKEAARLHHELHSTERTLYESRADQAHKHSDNIASIVLDCPKGYAVPHHQPETKDTWSAPKIDIDAVGSISHSTSSQHYYFYLPQWIKGPNLIITCLFLQITTMLTSLSINNLKPAVLWLQLDNASSENKNRWMLAFLCWLVHHHWFFEIMVCFLPPGHTHIDIDQMFSTLAIWLSTHSAHYITDLITKLPLCYKSATTRPSGSVIPTVFNWKGFFAPHMKEMDGLSKPHAFLIRAQPDGTVGIRFKKWVSDKSEPWQGDSSLPNSWMNLMRSFPEGQPNRLWPLPLATTATLASIRSMVNLSSTENAAWEAFFSTGNVAPPFLHPMENLFNMKQVHQKRLVFYDFSWSQLHCNIIRSDFKICLYPGIVGKKSLNCT